MHRTSASLSRRSRISPFMFLLLICSVCTWRGTTGEAKRLLLQRDARREGEDEVDERIHVYVDYWRDGYHRPPVFTRPHPGPINNVKRPSPALKP